MRRGGGGSEADKGGLARGEGSRGAARTVVPGPGDPRGSFAGTENWFVRHQIAKIAEFYARPAISDGPIASG